MRPKRRIFDAAQEAYRQAERCPGANLSYIRLNQAVLAGRRDKGTEALALLAEATDPEVSDKVVLTKGRILQELGRLPEALDVFSTALEALSSAPDAPESDVHGDLGARCARVRIDLGEPTATVLQALVDLVEQVAPSDAILREIREIDREISAAPHYYRLLLDCSDTVGYEGMTEFLRSADVVADSAEEALEFLHQLRAITDEWVCKIDESEILEERSNEFKGVYRFGARHYFDDASD